MSRRIKNTISSKELLQAMGGIRDCYVKEADYAACAATRKQPHRWYVAAGMAAMLALSILLPNLNKATAYAMQSLPVIGEYIKLVTFREYRFDDVLLACVLGVGLADGTADERDALAVVRQQRGHHHGRCRDEQHQDQQRHFY